MNIVMKAIKHSDDLADIEKWQLIWVIGVASW